MHNAQNGAHSLQRANHAKMNPTLILFSAVSDHDKLNIEPPCIQVEQWFTCLSREATSCSKQGNLIAKQCQALNLRVLSGLSWPMSYNILYKPPHSRTLLDCSAQDGSTSALMRSSELCKTVAGTRKVKTFMSVSRLTLPMLLPWRLDLLCARQRVKAACASKQNPK